MSRHKPDNGRYGQWAGNPHGVTEDKTRCAAEVWPAGRSMITYQCTRPRGHGENGEYCSQHGRRTDDIKPADHPIKRKDFRSRNRFSYGRRK